VTVPQRTRAYQNGYVLGLVTLISVPSVYDTTTRVIKIDAYADPPSSVLVNVNFELVHQHFEFIFRSTPASSSLLRKKRMPTSAHGR
jgi:hypothetical protein